MSALVAALCVTGALSAAPSVPVPQPYYVVMYRWPDHPHARFDLTPFEVEALLAHDGARHFEEISHGHLTLNATVHPEVVRLAETEATLNARGKAGPLRAQEILCHIERRYPCTPENRHRGMGGVDLRDFAVGGRPRLILLGTSSGGSRRIYRLHTALAEESAVDVLAWGIDGSKGASASHGSGWRVGAEELAHHLLAVGDYYRQKRHQRPFWTRPDGRLVFRDVATGWAKTQESWVHPTAWDKLLRDATGAVDRRPFWRAGSQVVTVPAPPEGEVQGTRVHLHPAELTLTLADPEAQAVLVSFEDSAPRPEAGDGTSSVDEHPFHGYLLEHRRRVGADEPLSDEGVLLWLVRDALVAPGRGLMLHRKSRAVLVPRRGGTLTEAPWQPGDTYTDPARGIELAFEAPATPGGPRPVLVRRTAPAPPSLAVRALIVDDDANGQGVSVAGVSDPLVAGVEGMWTLHVTVSVSAPVRGARLAVLARTDPEGDWQLVREGLLHLDPGEHVLPVPHPKRFKDPWGGGRKAALLGRLLADASAGAELHLRAVVFHELDPVAEDDAIEVTVRAAP